MENFSNLDALYQNYTEGVIDQRELEGKMFRIILENARSYHWFNGSEEDSVDYLCWIYPRLSRAIRHFKDSGAAFSTYIGALIRYSMKEYKTGQIDHYITEYAAWTTHNMDMEVRSPEFSYPEPEGREENEEESPPQTASLNLFKSRQILLLILKSYYFASEDFIERIAPYTGVNPEALKLMIDKLRFNRSRKEEEIRLFQERITTQFYRCISWERRLKILTPESTRYGVVKTQLERARKRLTGMRRRFSKFRLDATHRQIAEVTGISTGTVSSSLSTIMSQWELDNKGQPVRKPRAGKKSGTKTQAPQGEGIARVRREDGQDSRSV
ncbi:MAG: hypothetical protein LBP20_09895 [Treponema sp.]|jgi:hypothetical protein|nr:hypothetical protein [Treponema sp.]